MPKFRILTPAGLSFSNSGGGYSFEMEALEGLDAEIFECPDDRGGLHRRRQGRGCRLRQGHEVHARR